MRGKPRNIGLAIGEARDLAYANKRPTFRFETFVGVDCLVREKKSAAFASSNPHLNRIEEKAAGDLCILQFASVFEIVPGDLDRGLHQDRK